jgi:hypothetical protein
MNSKTMALKASLPIALTTVLGFAGAASAQVFSTGDTLNQFGSLQLDNITFGLPSILFVPEVGGTDPAAPGDLATEFLAIAGNTGGFAAYNGGVGGFPTPAAVRSFNALTDTAGFTQGAGGDTFVELPASALITAGASLTLNQATLEFVGAPGSGLPNISDDLEEGEFILRGFGLIQDIATGQIETIKYDFTAQGLTGGEDGITEIGSFSGTKIVIVDAPEPSSFLGLLAIGLLAATGVAKAKR